MHGRPSRFVARCPALARPATRRPVSLLVAASAVAAVAAACLARPLAAQAPDSVPPDSVVALEPLEVSVAEPRSAASSLRMPDERLGLLVAETPGDILRLTPGLTIARHAGGGKADQYLVRGFDADHGTDLALSWRESR